MAKKKTSLDITDFIDYDQIQEDISAWVQTRDNAKIVLHAGVGFVSGWLVAGGDILFGGLVLVIALWMAVTKSGDDITNWFLDKIQGVIKSNPNDKLKKAQEELKVAERGI